MALTHKSGPVQRPSILLVKGIDVGSFIEQEVHHLTGRHRAGGELHAWHGLEDAATDRIPYLSVAVEGGVMQRSASAAVRHVDAAQERDDHLGTAQSVVGCCHVQRRLPVLVSGVHVGRVVNQDADGLLRNRVSSDSRRPSSHDSDQTTLISACPKSETLGPEQNSRIALHGSNRGHLMVSTCPLCPPQCTETALYWPILLKSVCPPVCASEFLLILPFL